MNKDLTVYKANKLIEASYPTTTLSEQLLVLACIGQCNPLELSERTVVYLTVADYAALAEINATDAYDDLKAAAERLFNRYIIIANPDPDDPSLTYTRTRWVSSINYYSGEGKIGLRFAGQILPYLAQLSSRFTKYKLKHISQFHSQYGVRLYELLVQWQSRGTREVKLDWLHEVWGLEGKYSRMTNFKARVLDPAIRDINEYSDLWVKYTQRKAGRRVVALVFTFGLKAEEPRNPPITRTKSKAAPKTAEALAAITEAKLCAHASMAAALERNPR